MATINEVTILLDEMIASKQTYLDKKPNKFIEEEIKNLTVIKDTHNLMTHLITSMQISYKLLLERYEIDFKGKINPDNHDSHEEWVDNLKRLTGEIENGG